MVVGGHAFFTNKGLVDSLAWKLYSKDYIQETFGLDYFKLRTSELNFMAYCLSKTVAFNPAAIKYPEGKQFALSTNNNECNSWKDTLKITGLGPEHSVRVEDDFICFKVMGIKGTPMFLKAEHKEGGVLSYPLIYQVDSEKWRKVGESYNLQDVLEQRGWNVLAAYTSKEQRNGFQLWRQDEIKVHFVDRLENFLTVDDAIKFNFRTK